MENGGTWTGGVIEVVELREKRGWWSISVVGGRLGSIRKIFTKQLSYK